MGGRSSMKKRPPAKCWAVVRDSGFVQSVWSTRKAAQTYRSWMEEPKKLSIVLLVERRERRKKR